jgi:hypothetical protein
MMRLDDREWKDFPIPVIFQRIQRGKRLKNADHIVGNMPYVSSTANNNGVDDYIEASAETRSFKNCISLANSGSVGTAFYEPFEFVASDHVTSLKCQKANKYIYLFLATVLECQSSNFNFNREINDLRIKKMRIMLPTTDDDQPDYQFMEDYIRELMSVKKERFRQYAEKRIKSLEASLDRLGLDVARQENSDQRKSREWKPISISSIFEFARGRENNMAMLDTGDTPLISAKNGNNGLKGFVNTPKKAIPGHCITLNNDGDGGAGLAYYQPFSMALDTHVTALIPKIKMTQWVMLFISECLSGLHGFFGHGLSISNDRAKNIKIMLPVTDDGQPDYDFMDLFGRKMMLNKYKQYLNFLALSDTSGTTKNENAVTIDKI